jgi:hypothetical protein
MIKLNFDVNIDVIADDTGEYTKEWLETQAMRKIEVALLGMFNYPISADVTLESFNVAPGEEEE